MSQTELIKKAISICGTQAALASKAGVTQGLISAILRGEKKPGWKTCMAIEQATDGEVTRSDLRPDIYSE